MNNDLFLGSIYLGGLISFFSPCIFPIIPVYISILSENGKLCIGKTITFILGLSTSFILLGFSVGIIGEFLTGNFFRIFSGLMVIGFGIFQLEIVKIPFLEKTKLLNLETKNTTGLLSSFLLGFSFILGWTPCIVPILASILFVSSTSGDTLYSIWILLIYVLGLATPFVIFAIFWKYLRKFLKSHDLSKYLYIIKKIGGVLLIIMGILLVLNKLNIFL